MGFFCCFFCTYTFCNSVYWWLDYDFDLFIFGFDNTLHSPLYFRIILFFMIIWHCRSQLKHVDSNGIMNSHLWDTCPPLYLLNYRVHRDWRRVFIQLKCTRYSCGNFTLIHERMNSGSVLFQDHLQGYSTWTEIFFVMIIYNAEVNYKNVDSSGIWTRIGISNVQVQIPLESTFFSWLR